MSVGPKCKIFIGSSREASQIAKSLQHELRDNAYSELWSQGLFRVGTVGLEDLVQAANGFDFGVFVFAPDDVIKMRDKQYSAVRDNVLFELGIFVGKLGPQRSFFVVPEHDDQLHLPSDLNGVTPAKYNSKEPNPQVAVASASYEISRAIALLGPLHGSRSVLYDARLHGHPRLFRGKESYVYKKGERVGEKANGSLSTGSEGELTISRTNNAGRFEIHLRLQGPGKPSFQRSADPPPQRPLRVSCGVKAEGATHTVRFVAKDEENDKWLASKPERFKPATGTRLRSTCG